MSRVVSGDKEIDRCMTCGALWFDYGEIRELTDGRVPVALEPEASRTGEEGDGGEKSANAAPSGVAGAGAGKEKPAARIARLWSEAAARSCPRCGGAFIPVDFQMTGIPLLQCRECRGLLAPRPAAAGIDARFRFLRSHAGKFAALGETLAEVERKRMEDRLGPSPPPTARSGAGVVPLPIVVPLADEGPAPREFPMAAYGLAAVLLAVHIVRQISGAPPELPGGLDGLPSGTGFPLVPKAALLVAPFLHGGLFPLAVAGLFLLVLGDNVEDRIGPWAFLALFLFGGVVSGSVHVLWGEPGEPAALGSAGAAAAVLGAYLIFFPEVPVRMFGMGRVVSVPAYLFGCAWVVGTFLVGRDLLVAWINPAPYSFGAQLAGFWSGTLGAICWRWLEDSAQGG